MTFNVAKRLISLGIVILIFLTVFIYAKCFFTVSDYNTDDTHDECVWLINGKFMSQYDFSLTDLEANANDEIIMTFPVGEPDTTTTLNYFKLNVVDTGTGEEPPEENKYTVTLKDAEGRELLSKTGSLLQLGNNTCDPNVNLNKYDSVGDFTVTLTPITPSKRYSPGFGEKSDESKIAMKIGNKSYDDKILDMKVGYWVTKDYISITNFYIFASITALLVLLLIFWFIFRNKIYKKIKKGKES